MFTRNSAHSYNIIQTQENILYFNNKFGIMPPIGTRKSMYDVEEKFLVNKFDAELPIGTWNSIFEYWCPVNNTLHTRSA